MNGAWMNEWMNLYVNTGKEIVKVWKSQSVDDFLY